MRKILLWQTIRLWTGKEREFVKIIFLPEPLTQGVGVFVLDGQDPDVPHMLFWSAGTHPIQVANFRDSAADQELLDYMTSGWTEIKNFTDAYKWSA